MRFDPEPVSFSQQMRALLFYPARVVAGHQEPRGLYPMCLSQAINARIYILSKTSLFFTARIGV